MQQIIFAAGLTFPAWSRSTSGSVVPSLSSMSFQVPSARTPAKAPSKSASRTTTRRRYYWTITIYHYYLWSPNNNLIIIILPGGLQRIRNNVSSAEDEFNTIMLDRHAAGKLRRAFTLEEYNAIVSRLEAVKEGREKPNFNDIKMLKMYSIATYPNGEKFLVKLSKKDQAAMASNGGFSNLSREDLLNAERFIPIEKLFPFMITAHLETKHGKRDTLMKRLREMKVANAGRDTVLLFLSLCDTCVREREIAGLPL